MSLNSNTLECVLVYDVMASPTFLYVYIKLRDRCAGFYTKKKRMRINRFVTESIKQHILLITTGEKEIFTMLSM